MNFLFSSSEMNCTIVRNGYAETLVSAKLPAWALIVRYVRSVRKFTYVSRPVDLGGGRDQSSLAARAEVT